MRRRSAVASSGLSRPNLLLLGASTLSILVSAGFSRAQEAVDLDPLKVEAKVAKKKKAAAKKASTPVYAPAPVAPAPAPEEPDATPEQARVDAPYRTPASVSAASSSDLQTYGQINTGDVLRSLPGTSTRESINNPGVAVNIRGMEGSGRVNMTIDGVRQNFRFTGHEAQGFAYVDPNLLAGIDVQRGAVSTAGGAGALAGRANFRTLDVADIVRPGQMFGALTNVSWGTNEQGWSEMAAAGVTNGHVGFAGAISKRDPGNYENGDGITVPFTEQDLISGLFKAEFKLSDEHKLKFGGVIYDNDFLANSYYQNLRAENFTINYSYNPVTTDLVHLRINAYRSDVSMEYDTNDTGGGSAAGRVVDDEGKGFDISNTSQFALGAVRVSSNYGYEYFQNEVDAYNTLNPGAGGGVNPSGESSIQGLFSETKFSYGIFDLIAGLRYDTFKLEGTFNAKPGNPMGIPVGDYDLDNEDSRLNPSVTVAAQVLPWLQPYARYAEAFRAPTTSEAMAGGSHPGGGFGFSPNPFLEPETSKGWEFGTNVVVDGLLTRDDRFRFKANYYAQDIDNYITACFGAGGGVYFCNNKGTSQIQGVELEGHYDAGYVFAGLTYTYTHSDLPAQVNGFGAQSYLPDHVLTLTGGLRFLEQRLVVGARGYITSEAYNGADQPGTWFGPGVSANGDPNDPYNDGYALLDLYATYTTDFNTTLGVTVTNVFDETYTPEISTGASGFTGDTGRGRTALFTIRSQF